MHGNSRQVVSNQKAIHNRLENIISSHLQNEYKKPIGAPTRAAFETLLGKNLPLDALILDSGCGTGVSSIMLASQYPNHIVIAIDKSFARLQKLNETDLPANLVFLRADQFDFWRLAAQQQWTFQKHTIFYPNPWPKKKHVQRRIYAHPAFPSLLKISKQLVLRSNWKLYVAEFCYAYHLATGGSCDFQQIAPNPIKTLFEKKFLASGHSLYEVKLEPDSVEE